MQHDIVELLDAIKHAQENFGSDKDAKYFFVRRELEDAFGVAYREDHVKFECVQILAWVKGTKIEIQVIGLNDDVQFQREFIADGVKRTGNRAS
jgi:hypothetical protein